MKISAPFQVIVFLNTTLEYLSHEKAIQKKTAS